MNFCHCGQPATHYCMTTPFCAVHYRVAMEAKRENPFHEETWQTRMAIEGRCKACGGLKADTDGIYCQMCCDHKEEQRKKRVKARKAEENEDDALLEEL